MIEIDGSYGEGGGAIFRNTLALSSVTLRPVKIINIRAKRPTPGLKPQHLTVAKALTQITNADVTGLKIGSTAVTFKPRVRKAGDYFFDIGTAGSITLFLQATIPVAVFSESSVTLKVRGGTDVKWSPTIDYYRNVFLFTLNRVGVNASIEVVRRGHYPRGGGLCIFKSEPVSGLDPIQIVELGEILEIKGVAHSIKLPRHVAERMASSAEHYLGRAGIDVPINIELDVRENSEHLGPGAGISLWAITSTGAVVGSDSLGERGKPSEKVGLEAAKKLLSVLESGCPVDPHLSDMLIMYMALARGTSTIVTPKLTMHTESNMWVAEKMLNVNFSVKREKGKCIISVQGIGLLAR